MAAVRFEHVYKRYGDGADVISDLNLEIKDEEFLVLVGPSGCGKSTALRMIAGLEQISSGALFIGDQMINDVAIQDRDVAMVFQDYALYPHMSVFKNLAFGLAQHHMPHDEIERRVRTTAGLLEIDGYLDRKPEALSGGQQQRVALGRAIVREPRVFLMDEPLSNLDAQLRVQMRAEIARLRQRIKTTTIYVTHDQVEAMTMGDRIAVLNAGIIQQLGTPRELYETPANLFVAGFIGSPSMNFFTARLVRRAGENIVLVGTDERSQELRVAGPVARAIAARATADGYPVIVGIRPEDLTLASSDGAVPDATANTISGTVDVAEHLGNEQVVYLHVDGALISESAETRGTTTRLPPHLRLDPSAAIVLRVDPAHVHVFDAATSRRLA